MHPTVARIIDALAAPEYDDARDIAIHIGSLHASTPELTAIQAAINVGGIVEIDRKKAIALALRCRKTATSNPWQDIHTVLGCSITFVGSMARFVRIPIGSAIAPEWDDNQPETTPNVQMDDSVSPNRIAQP